MAKSTTPVKPAETATAPAATETPAVPQAGSIAPVPESTTPVKPAETATAPAVNGYSSDKVHLVKLDEKGEVIDNMVLPISTWNNLSPNHKKDWKVKKPDSIN
ncbi:MAG: hypothetical protein GXC72_00810 [Chitinophagaceae bacterium]|nr:hypothetical protein [Chitinophagaceae bacterium]